MIRRSLRRLQARAKAWRGASSRATPGSRPAASRAATRAGWVTATPGQAQAITSPKRRTPAAVGTGTGNGTVAVVMHGLLGFWEWVWGTDAARRTIHRAGDIRIAPSAGAVD